MFHNQLGKKTHIQPLALLQRINRRKLRDDSQIQCRDPERKIEIDKQRLLAGLLRQSYRKLMERAFRKYGGQAKADTAEHQRVTLEQRSHFGVHLPDDWPATLM